MPEGGTSSTGAMATSSGLLMVAIHTEVCNRACHLDGRWAMEEDAGSALPTEPSQQAIADPKDAPPPSQRAALPHAPGTGPARLVLKAAEQFWYVVPCLWFGAGHLSKLPTKRALCDAGVASMTSAENF